MFGCHEQSVTQPSKVRAGGLVSSARVIVLPCVLVTLSEIWSKSKRSCSELKEENNIFFCLRNILILDLDNPQANAKSSDLFQMSFYLVIRSSLSRAVGESYQHMSRGTWLHTQQRHQRKAKIMIMTLLLPGFSK